MTKIPISEGNATTPEYNSESEERIQQLLGSGIVLGLIFWAAYIVVSSKKIDSVDVITFELTIALIICFAMAIHLRRASVR